ncbi:unnamed protein product [Albugo candida]|uniref:Uncharacterized protein n=1 Tax=Albugo candida TaxID=65357 RepID=A0A024GEV4_9STRA|nr:unnamed protein product [Albugo candida]|eukprot:CCI45232.1 unnamed protein product [Albugo candida]
MLGDALCDEYSLSRCPRMVQEHCNQMGVWGGRTPCSMDSFFWLFVLVEKCGECTRSIISQLLHKSIEREKCSRSSYDNVPLQPFWSMLAIQCRTKCFIQIVCIINIASCSINMVLSMPEIPKRGLTPVTKIYITTPRIRKRYPLMLFQQKRPQTDLPGERDLFGDQYACSQRPFCQHSEIV